MYVFSTQLSAFPLTPSGNPINILGNSRGKKMFFVVFRIRVRMIRQFLGLPDPNSSVNKRKKILKTFVSTVCDF